MKRAVIVGSGIAGLAAALRLGRDGWRPWWSSAPHSAEAVGTW